MGETQAIILYLLSFRLAVVAAGVVSIVLGYRLFIHGSRVVSPGKSGEEIDVKVGGAQFTLKSVAPGTCFALFGAGLIVAMLLKAPPEVTKSDEGETYRGESVVTNESQWQPPVLKDTPTPAEIDSFWRNKAVSLNEMAWYLYEENSHLELAASLVQVSITSDPEGKHLANFVDTREKIQNRLANQ